MAAFTPLPPHVIHTDTSISHAEAVTLLAAFLDRAQNEPAYRPDSHLTESGPVSSSTNTRSDLTLHHLNRIKLGIEGKRLGPDTLEGQTGSGLIEFANVEKKKRKRDASGVLNSSSTLNLDASSPPQSPLKPRKGALETGTSTPKDWQDKSAYEQAQTDSDVDVNNAQHDPAGADLKQPRNEDEEEQMLEVGVHGQALDPREVDDYDDGGGAPAIGSSQATVLRPTGDDKAIRKQKKKDRKKLEKQQKEKARVRAKES